jgi:hypothetical protein
MDVGKIVAELKAEREQIEEAIVSLERLARGRVRADRQTGWLTPRRRSEAGRQGARTNRLR